MLFTGCRTPLPDVWTKDTDEQRNVQWLQGQEQRLLSLCNEEVGLNQRQILPATMSL